MESINRTIEYRSDIDGLRGIAIMSVVAFHLKIFGFDGGYVGVDIFFVISGYLITSIIHTQLMNRNFNIVNFYQKRILRLFPALIVTLLLTSAVSILLFSPQDLSSFGGSLAYASASFANMFFLIHTDYFSEAGDYTPLLHMWSLGVEEQFYFIWPCIVIFLLKIKTVNLRIQAVCIIILGVMVGSYYIGFSSSITFYTTVFRIHEFGFGALVYFYQNNRPNVFFKRAPIANDLLRLFAMSLISFAVINYAPVVIDRLVWCTIAALGAALLIFCGPSTRILSKFYDNKVFIFIGLISYSLYLMHWPVLVFLRYYYFKEPNFIQLCVAGIVFTILALFTHFLVEKKFLLEKDESRNKTTVKCALTLVSLMLLCLLGADLWGRDGWAWRLAPNSKELAVDSNQFRFKYFGGKGVEPNRVEIIGDLGSKPSFLMIGDSYGHHFAHGFDRRLKIQKKSAWVLFDHGCIISNKLTRYFGTQEDIECSSRYNQISDILKTGIPIIVSYSFSTYFRKLGYKNAGKPISGTGAFALYDLVLDNIFNISQSTGNYLVVIGMPPGSGNEMGVLNCITRPLGFSAACGKGLKFDSQKSPNYKINKFLESRVATVEQAEFWDPFDSFCSSGECQSFEKKKIYYSDGSHLSTEGSYKFILDFEEKLIRMLSGFGP